MENENENNQQTAVETKQAETRLKEMSRRAKQKGKDKTATKTKSVPPLFNQNWFCIGIGLATITGITYLIYRAQSKGGHQDFKFTPVSIPGKEPLQSESKEASAERGDSSSAGGSKFHAPKQISSTQFELNSF